MSRIHTVAVCGAGTMGTGIATACLTSHFKVHLFDINQDQLNRSSMEIRKRIEKAVERGKIDSSILDTLSENLIITSETATLADCHLVIETIAEDNALKKSLYADIESVVPDSCIVATNTSSLSVASLASEVKSKHRFIGMHFFNPANVMQLVELIPCRETSAEVLQEAGTFVTSLRKTPVIAADVPGFIVNRIARNFYNEPMKIVAEGITDFATADMLMRGLGFKMGPFELMDLIGVDINYQVTVNQWSQYYHEPRFMPSLIQKQLLDAGLHGRKSGRGFFDYE